MKLSKTNFILGLFIVFVLFLISKSAVNILKAATEIKNQPTKENLQVCPSKTAKDFSNLKDGEYLYALYRYESLGVKCAKQ